MSYSRTPGLGAFQAGDVYPAGTQVVGGFQVVGLPSASEANAIAQLRSAIGASFSIGGVAPASAPAPRNRFHEIGRRAGLSISAPSRARDSVGWGPSYGVSSGRLYAMIVTNRDGVTGAQINSALAAVAREGLSPATVDANFHLTESQVLLGQGLAKFWQVLSK